jgi:hypothetical protein
LATSSARKIQNPKSRPTADPPEKSNSLGDLQRAELGIPRGSAAGWGLRKFQIDFAAMEFRRQYYHPRTLGKNLVILYMNKVDALNLLVNSDLRNSKSLVVKQAIKCEFRRFFVILTSKERTKHRLDYTSGFSVIFCIIYPGMGFLPHLWNQGFGLEAKFPALY